MRVLVWELALAHGLSCREFLLDGYAMVRYLTQLLKSTGAEVTVLVSRDIAQTIDLPDVKIVPVSSGQSYTMLRELSSMHDVAFLIAPPLELIRAYRYVRCEIAGPSFKIVHVLARKDLTYRIAEALDLPVPKYVLVKCPEEAEHVINVVGLPCVVKPVDSAGCHGIRIVYNEKELHEAIRDVVSESPVGVALVMEYVNGVAASCSLVISKNGNVTLSVVNLQYICREDRNFAFCGILSPASSNITETATIIVNRIVRELGNSVVGYLNIDFVVSSNGIPYIMEVNPRISMSLINISYLYDMKDLARALLMQDVKPRRTSVMAISLLRKRCLRTVSGLRVLDKVCIPHVDDEYLIVETSREFS